MFLEDFSYFCNKNNLQTGKLLTMMDKKKVIFEHELHSRSAKIIWPLISAPEGLAKWIADDVKRDGDAMTFGWGVPWRHHESRTATITEELQPSLFRWVWDDDEDYYVEMKLERSDITGDYILIITDFTDEDDEDWLTAVWEGNFERLHNTTGL